MSVYSTYIPTDNWWREENNDIFIPSSILDLPTYQEKVNAIITQGMAGYYSYNQAVEMINYLKMLEAKKNEFKDEAEEVWENY